MIDVPPASDPRLVVNAEAPVIDVLRSARRNVVTRKVVDIYLAMDFTLVGDRIGYTPGRGYVDGTEAAWELLEQVLKPFCDEIVRHARMGFSDTASIYAAGVLDGLAELRDVADQQTVIGWVETEECVADLADGVPRTAQDAASQPADALGYAVTTVDGVRARDGR